MRTHKREIPASVRAVCYERDGGKCQEPGCDLMTASGDRMNLHHIRPEQFGGTEDPNNLITLCDIHHKAMHVEFNAFYPDSQHVLRKMRRITRIALSRIHRLARVDDGYDLSPYLHFLSNSSQFRSGQLKAIRAALRGENVLFVSPTGSGKSVCYQLPGLLADNPTLVISPLKALMKDQVTSIWKRKIPTTYINSDLAYAEKQKRYQFITQGLYKFIFASPERFFGSKDPEAIKLYLPYSHLIIDEAHEIEMWGMAFRPSYRKLGELRDNLGKPPVMALTATASKATQRYIVESLRMDKPQVIVTGFYQKNTTIYIHKANDSSDDGTLARGKYKYLKQLLEHKIGQKILIFVPTIASGDALLTGLKADGFIADFYHGSRYQKDKMDIQDRFSGISDPSLNILIATSAFGMGVNIPNIRVIVHWAPALSLTDYTQQVGRAGRDGKQSEAHLLYERKDEGLLRFMARKSVEQKGFKEKHGYSDEDISKVTARLDQQVDDMLGLLDVNTGTEWSYIIDYFGEQPTTTWETHGQKVVDSLLVCVLLILFGIALQLLRH